MCFEKFLYNFGNPSKAGGSIKIRTALGKLILTFEMFAHLSLCKVNAVSQVLLKLFWLENIALRSFMSEGKGLPLPENLTGTRCIFPNPKGI